MRNKSLIWLMWFQISVLLHVRWSWDGFSSAMSFCAVWAFAMLSYTNQQLCTLDQNSSCKEMRNDFSGFWKLLVDAQGCQMSHRNEYDYDSASFFHHFMTERNWISQTRRRPQYTESVIYRYIDLCSNTIKLKPLFYPWNVLWLFMLH